MDRMEEYAALQAQLEEHPSALAYTVQRARARRARRRRLRRFGVPLGSLAGAMALFVLLVNLSAPFALACSHIPVLKELAAAVSFSPTLSTAVEHDYAQRIDQTQSANGVTMTLNYLMADPAQLIFFVTVTGPEDASLMELRPKLKGPDGEELEGFSLMSSSVAPGELSNAITAAIGTEDFAFPETLRLDCEVRAYLPGVTDPESWTPDARFTFEFPLDARFREQGRTLALDRWVELDGNRIRLVSLELYPTHARLNLEQDPDNAEQLQTLDFYLEDENGVRYEKGHGGHLSLRKPLLPGPEASDASHHPGHLAGPGAGIRGAGPGARYGAGRAARGYAPQRPPHRPAGGPRPHRPRPARQYGDVPRLLSALRRPLPFARRGDARPELLQHHFLRRPLVGDGG